MTDLKYATVSARAIRLEKRGFLHRLEEGTRVLHFLTQQGKEVLATWKESSDAKFVLDRYMETIKQKAKRILSDESDSVDADT